MRLAFKGLTHGYVWRATELFVLSFDDQRDPQPVLRVETITLGDGRYCIHVDRRINELVHLKKQKAQSYRLIELESNVIGFMTA